MNDNDVVEIDLLQVLAVVQKNLLLFIAICVLTCTAGFATCKFAMTEEFSATAKIIIVKDESKSSSTSLTSSDIQLSQKLASTYKQIIMSEAISDTVIDNLDLRKKGFTSTTYNNCVSVSAADQTEVMNISVTTSDPQMSADIANEVVDVFISKIYDIMEVQNVTILNNAKVPTKKSGPSTTKWTAIGGLVGLVICGIIALIKVFTDTKIKSEEEVKAIFNNKYPIIGTIPDFLEKEIEYDDDNE